ncbi:DinB family protein [Lentzea sp. HUAS12]|uniref:DinB family protein n=1 Tax=Lentzea sp. HUAS12 TaxID=2951806 RepID=UPI00209E9071|nr:DinB family protein [Lentzea sp. HUAS12]USX55887.1 DinB family protein [Lentzea sp. HUAS12]
MQETQREPVPRVDTGELAVAHEFLKFQRHCVLKKTEGLTDEQLRRVLVPSGTSILGLVQHLAEVERGWFAHHLAGGPKPDGDLDMAVAPGRSAADVIADYRAAAEDSDRAIEAAGGPEALLAVPIDGVRMTLRWLLAHMNTETARHAGHADVLREQIDGTTGR